MAKKKTKIARLFVFLGQPTCYFDKLVEGQNVILMTKLGKRGRFCFQNLTVLQKWTKFYKKNPFPKRERT